MGLILGNPKSDHEFWSLPTGFVQREFDDISRVAKRTRIGALIRIGRHFAAAVLASEMSFRNNFSLDRAGVMRRAFDRAAASGTKTVPRFDRRAALNTGLALWLCSVLVDYDFGNQNVVRRGGVILHRSRQLHFWTARRAVSRVIRLASPVY